MVRELAELGREINSHTHRQRLDQRLRKLVQRLHVHHVRAASGDAEQQHSQQQQGSGHRHLSNMRSIIGASMQRGKASAKIVQSDEGAIVAPREIPHQGGKADAGDLHVCRIRELGRKSDRVDADRRRLAVRTGPKRKGNSRDRFPTTRKTSSTAAPSRPWST
jgi:hypothetical protein